MLVQIERRAFERSEFPRTFGRGALPVKPTKSEETRGIEKTELLTFTSLSPSDVDRATQLMSFERLLNGAYSDIKGANDIRPWSLTGRDLFEDFSPQVLSQVLSAAMMMEPAQLRAYHPATDKLLLALHNPTARGRVGQKFWSAANHVRHKLPFNDWRVSPRLDSTPRTLAAKSTGIDLDHEQIKALSTHTMHLFPADHSTIVLRTMSPLLAEVVDDGSTIPRDVIGGEDNSFLSVYHDGHVFGLRHAKEEEVLVGSPVAEDAPQERPQRPTRASTGGAAADAEVSKQLRANYTASGAFASHYVCDFENGVRVQACEGSLARKKPDGYHTISLRHTFPSGLIVTHCTDGSVRMDTVTGAKASVFGDKAAEELCRIMQSKGTVIRHLRDGSTHILYSDGSSSFKAKDDADFTLTSASDGCSYKKTADPYSGAKGWEKHEQLTITKEHDPQTKDLVTTIEHPDGSRTRRLDLVDGSILVVHAEGTVVRSAKTIEDEDGVHFSPKILVEAKGFAAVEFDTEVEAQARGYAEGKQIAISKGGDMIRSRTAFPDGSYALMTFDTRITSPLCGRIIAVRPDRTEIIASDDGVVIHRVRALWAGNDSYECERMRKKGVVKKDAASPKKKKLTIKDDPDAQPDPDLEKECFVFDLVEGKMRTSDLEHNLFEAWLGAVPKSGLVNVELAGVLGPDDINDGMKKVPAVVNEPIEPRMFVVGRDGSGFEILSKNNIDDWERRVKNEAGTLRDVTMGEKGGCIDQFGDPGDLRSSEREFESKMRYVTKETWKEQGDSGKEVYINDFGCLYAKVFGVCWDSTGVVEQWHATQLPSCARYSKKKGQVGCNAVVGFEENPTGNVLDRCPEILVTRRWVKKTPLGGEQAKELCDAIESCEQWRMARQNTIERFSVDDDRPLAMIKAEDNMAKILKKAYKAAKANRKREKERERATMLKNRQTQLAKEQAAGAQAGTSQIPGMGGLQRIESVGLIEEDEEDDADWDSDDDDKEVVVSDDHSAEWKEAQEVFDVCLRNEELGDMDEDEWEEAKEAGEVVPAVKLSAEGCREAVVQILGCGVSAQEMERNLEGMKEVNLNEFYRVLMKMRGERERGEVKEDEDEGRGEEKKEEANSEFAEEEPELVAAHGAFFSTADGIALREKSIKDKTYFPKKKGDIRWLSTEPTPKPAITIRPKTVGGGEGMGLGGFDDLLDTSVYGEDSELGGGKGGRTEGGVRINMMYANSNQVRGSTAPAAIGNAGSRSSSPDAGMSVSELREMAATGSGRNAVRAQALLNKDEGKRFREGERPADVDIHGQARDKPVRIVDRAKGKANMAYQSVENDAYKGRNTPDVSIRSLSPSPSSFVPLVGTMEVIPQVVNFGFVKVGAKCGATLKLGNTGSEGVRYGFQLTGVGEGAGVEVVDKPRGTVAAGIKCAVGIEVEGREPCEITGVLRVSSQFETVEIKIMGNVVTAEEFDVVSGKSKRSKQVFDV